MSKPIIRHCQNCEYVATVKHGEWEEKLIESNGVAEIKSVCSLCGKTNKHYMPPFCPHCGAKMDKEVETREETGINAHEKGWGSE